MIRRNLWLACVFAVVAAVSFSAAHAATLLDEYKLIKKPFNWSLDGKEFSNAVDYNNNGVNVPSALEYGSTTYVPFKMIIEAFDYGLLWNVSTRTAVLVDKDNSDNGGILQTNEAVNLIKTKFKAGLSTNTVQSWLGMEFTSWKDSETGNYTWRYDLPGNSSYIFEGKAADIEGLERGKIDAQLFIYWKDGKVDHYALWYVQGEGKERKIYTYIIDSEGNNASAL